MFPRSSQILASEFRNHLADGLAPMFYESEDRAVRIENNSDQSFRELSEIVGNGRTFKRKSKECTSPPQFRSVPYGTITERLAPFTARDFVQIC